MLGELLAKTWSRIRQRNLKIQGEFHNAAFLKECLTSRKGLAQCVDYIGRHQTDLVHFFRCNVTG